METFLTEPAPWANGGANIGAQAGLTAYGPVAQRSERPTYHWLTSVRIRPGLPTNSLNATDAPAPGSFASGPLPGVGHHHTGSTAHGAGREANGLHCSTSRPRRLDGLWSRQFMWRIRPPGSSLWVSKEARTCERRVERLLRHVLRNRMRVAVAGTDRERKRHVRRSSIAPPSVCCPAETTSANREGPGCRSVELELKLGVVAPARSGATLEGDYLPVLACEDGLEVAIEHLSIGRGDFQPERIVAGPHNLARDLPL